jgi:hypothetical protein
MLILKDSTCLCLTGECETQRRLELQDSAISIDRQEGIIRRLQSR